MPVQVSADFLSKLLKQVEVNPETEIEVNLEKQTISVKDSELSEDFEIDAYKKTCMINGYDDIDYLDQNLSSCTRYCKACQNFRTQSDDCSTSEKTDGDGDTEYFQQHLENIGEPSFPFLVDQQEI